MPNFEVQVSGPVESRVWIDPASVTKPSRVTGSGARQPRRLKVLAAGGLPQSVDLAMVLDGESGPLSDTEGGEFETWCLEHASVAEPRQTHPAGWSSTVAIEFSAVGHYTVGAYHKSIGSPAVLLHLDVESTA